jgi:hypothetical protein
MQKRASKRIDRKRPRVRLKGPIYPLEAKLQGAEFHRLADMEGVRSDLEWCVHVCGLDKCAADRNQDWVLARVTIRRATIHVCVSASYIPACSTATLLNTWGRRVQAEGVKLGAKGLQKVHCVGIIGEFSHASLNDVK